MWTEPLGRIKQLSLQYLHTLDKAGQSDYGIHPSFITSPIPQRLSSCLSPQVQINACLSPKTLSLQLEVEEISPALLDANSVLSCAFKLSLFAFILFVDRALITLLLRDIDSKWGHWPQTHGNPNCVRQYTRSLHWWLVYLLNCLVILSQHYQFHASEWHILYI